MIWRNWLKFGVNQSNMCVCFFVFQMRGRTPNTRPGRELRMERWPSGGRVYQVTHTHIMLLWSSLFCPLWSIHSFLPRSLLVLLCVIPPAGLISTQMKIRALKIEHTPTSAEVLYPCYLREDAYSRSLSPHLELVAYFQVLSERCSQNFPIHM